MAIFTIPAIDSAITTSILEKRSSLRRSPLSLAGARCWVSPECRKMACGITVAPMIPTAMVSACASGNCGVTMPMPAAAQSTGTINISTR
ncbi:hypothetical protein D3C78_1438860 [compost metagenome]